MKLILLFWVILIFLLSHQTATQSGKLSNKVKKAIKAKKSVRKYAHFFEYMILGIISFFVFKNTVHPKLNSFLLCYIYASLDEIHQYFIEGRHCQVKDVLIDCSGSLIGIFLVSLI